MEWIERVKDIISGLRASGKKEDEVKEIVAQAADKATVKNRAEENLPDVKAEYAWAHEKNIPMVFALVGGAALTRMTGGIHTETAALFGVPERMLRDMLCTDEWQEYERQMKAVAPIVGVRTRDAVDAIMYAVTAMQQYKRESNNWRKMHGLPMRRKGKRR